MDEAYHQQEGGYSVQMCHNISMKDTGYTSLVWCGVCSMDLSHHQYGGECAVQDYQNFTGGGVVGGCIYLRKIIFYRKNLL